MENLSNIKKNQKVKIKAINDSFLRITLLKMGMMVGDEIIIKERFSNGPVLISNSIQDIALGYDQLSFIEVSYV